MEKSTPSSSPVRTALCSPLARIIMHLWEFVIHSFTDDFFTVDEEDEVSIKEAVEMIAKALDFKGKIHVSFKPSSVITLCLQTRSLY